MGLSGDLRRANLDLWERMVTHAFVRELGDGSLSAERFRRYMLQDYVFLKDLVTLTALGIAKAPDLDAARRLDGFLSPVLNGEEALFRRAFESLGDPADAGRNAEPLPTTAAFGAFLASVAYEGGYEEILTCLLVTEGTYVDWARCLAQGGAAPGNAFYQEWIDIHASEELAAFVAWVEQALDASALASAQAFRLGEVFRVSLEYELRFWDMAYNGEAP